MIAGVRKPGLLGQGSPLRIEDFRMQIVDCFLGVAYCDRKEEIRKSPFYNLKS